MKKSATALVLLLILGVAAYWLQASGQFKAYWPGASVAQVKPEATRSGQGQRGPLSVEVATAKEGQLSDDIAAIGSLVSEESVDISAETNGRIVEILFADGTQVNAGDVLFRLDDTLVKAVVTDAEAKLALAKTVVERNAALLKSRNIAQSIVDQSNTELTLAESALALAQVQLGKLTIRAPFSGRAGFRGVSIGAYVQAGAPLVHVEKIDLLKAAFSVPELNFSQLALGQSIMVSADALPGQTFEAKISAIDPLVDINGRALRVRADLDNSADKLRPGDLLLIFFVWYGLTRFLLEFMRSGNWTFFGIPTAQIVSAGFIIVGLALLWYRHGPGRTAPTADDPASAGPGEPDDAESGPDRSAGEPGTPAG